MSETPRTDEQELAYVAEDGSTYVHTTFARQLEREIAELLKDKERLEWILNNYTLSCGITREEVDEKIAELGK